MRHSVGGGFFSYINSIKIFSIQKTCERLIWSPLLHMRELKYRNVSHMPNIKDLRNWDLNLRILAPDAMLLTTTLIYIRDHPIPQIAYFKLVTKNEFFQLSSKALFLFTLFMISALVKYLSQCTDYWGK